MINRYGPRERLVTRVDCHRVAEWMGGRREYAGAFLAALAEAKNEGDRNDAR